MSEQKRTVSILLEGQVRKQIKEICKTEGWTLGHFYECAIKELITEIDDAHSCNFGFLFREMPNNLEHSSIWIRARIFEEVVEKSPGVFKRNILYTAIHNYLDRFTAEI